MKQLKDIMTSNVQVVFPQSSIREAANKMKTLNVGMLPVCENDRLTGTITDRDIAIRSVAEGLNPEQVRVKDVMTPGVVYCFSDTSVQEAADLMQSRQIRRIIVLDRKKRLTGIVSLGDLAVETGKKSLAGETLQKVSESSSVRRGFLGRMRNQRSLSNLSIFLGVASLLGSYLFFNQRRQKGQMDQTHPLKELAA